MIVRDAVSADADAIAAIWNPLIRDTFVTFTTMEKSAGDVATLIADRQCAGHGFLVAVAANDLLGFATYAPFRSGPGYAHTMEHSVILAASARAQGIGRVLMARLEAHAKAAGAHSMIAGISAENSDAIGFHQALGYGQTAVLPQAGWKFDRWIDLHLLQKFL